MLFEKSKLIKFFHQKQDPKNGHKVNFDWTFKF